MKRPTLCLPILLAATSSARSILATSQRSSELTDDFDGPAQWKFTLQNWSGDGCPDFGNTSATPGYSFTRQSSGPFMSNSSADTFWSYISFPWMQASLDGNNPSKLARISCDVTVLYEEVTPYGSALPPEKRTHKLKLHKNGSTIEANYKLDKGVNAEWQVRFYDPQDFTVMAQDWASVDGPLESGNDTHMAFEWLPPLFAPDPYVQSECGRSVFRIRLDLWLASRATGAGGKVFSKRTDWNNGKGKQWDGVNLGYSYDWEKC
ncbi:uncharacterized protein EI97DRAFT_498625 [Westerdykella ornata]|uniref:Concanavalin A-like lectin/glucanase n=1 Tax=Westerdykella ornata TaxID=318751 RepID=A0A6A6JXB3_WESOR|nr:uncharacterized protein EI97DRAFT_498625 [Westerdykella ornata]KAF2280458.1 hypothetical protein EI97DRAFT_498625 [Westerdykella ornata]